MKRISEVIPDVLRKAGIDSSVLWIAVRANGCDEFIIRSKKGLIIAEGFTSVSDAMQWIAKHDHVLLPNTIKIWTGRK